MSKSLTLLLVLFAAALHGVAPATAQVADESASRNECAGPVYKAVEVSRPARITEQPTPKFTEEARVNDASGTVALRGVLCSTGRVTDIEVVRGLPHGMTEKAIEAARRIKFTPAERGGRPVSQWFRIDYTFNSDGGQLVEDSGQLVEEVQFDGNRRMTDEDIFSHVQTRPGDPYDPVKVQRDLQALLGLSLFDPKATSVTTTSGPRGGVVVVFTVAELPVVRDVVFVGFGNVRESEVWKALRENGAGFKKEMTYDPAKIKNAERVIRELFAARGRPDVSVQTSVEAVSSLSVVLTFTLSEGRWF